MITYCIYQGKRYELVCENGKRVKIRSDHAEFVKRVWFKKVYTNTKWVPLKDVRYRLTIDV